MIHDDVSFGFVDFLLSKLSIGLLWTWPSYRSQHQSPTAWLKVNEPKIMVEVHVFVRKDWEEVHLESKQ